jgi:hypothetical protein
MPPHPLLEIKREKHKTKIQIFVYILNKLRLAHLAGQVLLFKNRKTIFIFVTRPEFDGPKKI